MPRAKVISPVKCAHCDEVTVFEIHEPTAGRMSFQLICAYCSKSVTNPQGNIEVVDLKDYDEPKLKRVKFL